MIPRVGGASWSALASDRGAGRGSRPSVRNLLDETAWSSTGCEEEVDTEVSECQSLSRYGPLVAGEHLRVVHPLTTGSASTCSSHSSSSWAQTTSESHGRTRSDLGSQLDSPFP